MANPLPPCETTGLINLCPPAEVFTAGAKVDQGAPWFLIQEPNLIWFLVVIALVVVGILLPFPTREIDTKGYDAGEGS